MKELEDELRKIKTLINKSKCMSCQEKFYQITENEQDTIKPKHTETGKNLEQLIIQGVKTLLIILDLKSKNDKQSAQRKV